MAGFSPKPTPKEQTKSKEKHQVQIRLIIPLKYFTALFLEQERDVLFQERFLWMLLNLGPSHEKNILNYLSGHKIP
jgi:hypothetical protein